MVTTPISLLNNFNLPNFAIFFSPSYPLLLIILFFFSSHFFHLSFRLSCLIFFYKPSYSWGGARAHAHAHARTRTRGSRLVVSCFAHYFTNFLPIFRNFLQFLPLSNQPDISIFGRHFATHIFKISAFFSATFREQVPQSDL